MSYAASTPTGKEQAPVYTAAPQGHRRRDTRYFPQKMYAMLTPMRAGLSPDSPAESVVVDFAMNGAALLVAGDVTLPEIGGDLQIQIRYQGLITRTLAATIVHHRKYGAFSHLGLAYDALRAGCNDFEQIEMRCIEQGLFL